MSRPKPRRPDRPVGQEERWYYKVVRFLAYLSSLIGGAGGRPNGPPAILSETNQPSQLRSLSGTSGPKKPRRAMPHGRDEHAGEHEESHDLWTSVTCDVEFGSQLDWLDLRARHPRDWLIGEW